MNQSQKVKLVAKILQKQLNLTGGMTNEQAIGLAYQIVTELEKDTTKVTNLKEVKRDEPA